MVGEEKKDGRKRFNPPKFKFFINQAFQLVNFMYVCNVKQKRHDYGNGKQKIPRWDTDI